MTSWVHSSPSPFTLQTLRFLLSSFTQEKKLNKKKENQNWSHTRNTVKYEKEMLHILKLNLPQCPRRWLQNQHRKRTISGINIPESRLPVNSRNGYYTQHRTNIIRLFWQKALSFQKPETTQILKVILYEPSHALTIFQKKLLCSAFFFFFWGGREGTGRQHMYK